MNRLVRERRGWDWGGGGAGGKVAEEKGLAEAGWWAAKAGLQLRFAKTTCIR